MKITKDTERAFKEFEAKVNRLLEAEKQLNALDAPAAVFGVELDAVRKKLKHPSKVEEVEQQFSALKQKVSEYNRTRAKGVPPTMAAVETTPALEDQYAILEKLGSGGFSDVHKAERKDGLVVAIKIPRLIPGQTFVPTDFLKEAELWSKLDHPNIVKIYEYGAKPYPWIAMEYMDGGSLRGRIGELSLGRAIGIGIKIAEALFYASHLGVIHRDLKPENVLFDLKDTAKITDWGLGKSLLDSSGSVAGFKGTLAYSAPEQLSVSKFGTVDWRTDIYQLGVILYEMIVGRWIIESAEPGATVTQILTEEVMLPSQQISGIPEELDKTVMKAIAKRKEDRYQDVSALTEDLKKASERQGVLKR